MKVSPAPVRFDQARQGALGIAHEAASTGVDVLIVRDLLGRLTLVLDDRTVTPDESAIARWKAACTKDLGAYASVPKVLLGSELFESRALLDSPMAFDAAHDGLERGQGKIRWLENRVVGESWAHVAEPRDSSAGQPARATLYAFKGGVGRSTATAMLAHKLAESGKRVLVVDLDLESPGVGPLLLNVQDSPSFGLVDELVEAAVGNNHGLDLIAPSSYYPRRNGELWVAPARGCGLPDMPYSYLEKLNRIYSDSPTEGAGNFADRLEAAVVACETAMTEAVGAPEVVLLDSRAGIHDIAAVAISKLCDVALLFGTDSTHTWDGYRDLFTAWRAAGQAPAIRERLRMVAAMVPPSGQGSGATYLQRFRENASDCFSTLYDDQVADAEDGLSVQMFNPALEDDAAPHSPIPILFSSDFVGMDPSRETDWVTRPLIEAAYSTFLETASRLICPDGAR